MSSSANRRRPANPPVHIPTHWSGDEALAFVAFLDRLEHAIWVAHGPEMAASLQRADDLQAAWITSPGHAPPVDLDDEEDENDIPF